MCENHVFDIIIIGGGPAGYTAALYAARSGLDAIVLERLSAGGQMALTHEIDNYPGFEDTIDGFSLGDKMKRQAERFGAKTKTAEVVEVNFQSNPKIIKTANETLYSKAVILSTGANPRELGIENERELTGRGVSYCAACDGMFYRNKTVVVVGGGNSAAADALLLSRVAKKVYIVHRRDSLKATKVYHEPLMNAQNVEFVWDSVVSEFVFDNKVSGVRVKNTKTSSERVIDCDGVFISIGRSPATDFLRTHVELDSNGYVVAGEDTKTNVRGVFAAGDLRTKPFRQIVTAVADGAVAVEAVQEFLAEGEL